MDKTLTLPLKKLLKALINEHGTRFRYVHDLNALEADLAPLGETLPTLPIVLADLNEYATVYRYGDAVPPQPLDRSDCREAVRLVREYVTARIAALGQLPP